MNTESTRLNSFATRVRGMKISARSGQVKVYAPNEALLDEDDVQAVIKALDIANTIAGLGD